MPEKKIAECYRRWRDNGGGEAKFELAIKQLADIEEKYPDQASRAVRAASQWYEIALNEKQAITHAKRVVSQYPKSAEAKPAAEFLKSKGITDLGGESKESK